MEKKGNLQTKSITSLEAFFKLSNEEDKLKLISGITDKRISVFLKDDTYNTDLYFLLTKQSAIHVAQNIINDDFFKFKFWRPSVYALLVNPGDSIIEIDSIHDNCETYLTLNKKPNLHIWIKTSTESLNPNISERYAILNKVEKKVEDPTTGENLNLNINQFEFVSALLSATSGTPKIFKAKKDLCWSQNFNYSDSLGKLFRNKESQKFRNKFLILNEDRWAFSIRFIAK